jgi:hypothetical protein
MLNLQNKQIHGYKRCIIGNYNLEEGGMEDDYENVVMKMF